MDTVNGAWQKLAGSTSQLPSAATQLTEQDSSAFKFLELSKTQRLQGFGACWGIGFVLSIIGAIVFVFGQVTLFATLYTIGVVISLIGTGFLLGFLRQVKMMWDPVRRYAAAFFVLCIALTFVFAFAVRVDALVIVFAIATYLSYAWYSLSYIPYARDFAKRLSPF